MNCKPLISSGAVRRGEGREERFREELQDRVGGQHVYFLQPWTVPFDTVNHLMPD
jgi:hypothetical protein